MGNRNLSVGLFVIAALTLGAVLTVWFTGQRGNIPVNRYHVLITSDVSGLTLGGPVYFMGVQVGEVADLTIVPGNPASVRVEIRIREEAPVDSGTWATLAAQGITGVSVINLYADPGAHDPLRVADGETLPVIPYRDTGFSALLSSAPAVLDKMDRLLANANVLLGPDNQTRVADALGNIERLTQALASQEAQINALPGALDSTLAELRRVTNEVGALLEGVGPKATSALDNIESTTAELRAVTSRLDHWLARHDGDVDAFAADGLGQVPALVSDTRDTLREMEKLLESLRHDPSRAIYQPTRDPIVVEE
ncbi:MAG: MlaD family protein [Xanthomonadales bacterium]|nr:MlaD family protein [Xanthomonadales bacterium]